jgi:regulator of nucleoside diphosphate kinase
MNFDERQERTLTELDHARITKLARSVGGALRRRGDGDPLASTLEGAEVVAPTAVPADVVTMNSQVRLRELDSERLIELTLCYPEESRPDAGFVSVLSPLGSSLLGLRTGGEATWSLPGGDRRSARLEAVTFQPEASGDYSR